jgi:hypothetical protein
MLKYLIVFIILYVLLNSFLNKSTKDTLIIALSVTLVFYLLNDKDMQENLEVKQDQVKQDYALEKYVTFQKDVLIETKMLPKLQVSDKLQKSSLDIIDNCNLLDTYDQFVNIYNTLADKANLKFETCNEDNACKEKEMRDLLDDKNVKNKISQLVKILEKINYNKLVKCVPEYNEMRQNYINTMYANSKLTKDQISMYFPIYSRIIKLASKFVIALMTNKEGL